MTFICRQKSTSSFTFFLSYFFIAKILQTCFRYFGHALLCTPKVILSIYWKLLCLSAGGKNQLHPPCFSEDWLTAFWPINREPEFCQIWDWWWNINNNISFHFKFLINFSKNTKKLFWGQFGSFLLKFGQKWIFMEKRALPNFKYSNYLRFQLFSNESFLIKMLNW